MNAVELRENISILRVTNKELAQLLDVSERTVQRWLSARIEIPGAAGRAIEAWIAMDAAGLPWRPDGVPLLHLQPGGKVSVGLAVTKSNAWMK